MPLGARHQRDQAKTTMSKDLAGNFRRLAVPTALARMDAELGADPYVREMLEFLSGGTHRRGIVPWSRQAPSD